MASLSLGTLVYAQTGSPLLAAATMFGPSLVQLAGASTLMSAADTLRPRHALTAVCIATTVGLVLQAALPLAPWTRLLVALAGAFVMSIGSGLRWGLLAEVLPRGQYALARSAMNVSVGVMQVLGFAVGGSLLHLLGVEQVLWVAAALAALAVPITWTGVDDRRPRRTGRTGLGETWRGNRILLTLPSTTAAPARADHPQRPGRRVRGAVRAVRRRRGRGALRRRGRRHARRRRAGGPGPRRGAATGVGAMAALVAGGAVPLLRLAPGTPVAALLAGCACLGYAATLAQQELLVELTPPDLSGQVLGAESAARATCQGLGALLAGAMAEVIDPGHAIAVLAVVSLLVCAALTRPLARATQPRPRKIPPPGRNHDDRHQLKQLLKMQTCENSSSSSG